MIWICLWGLVGCRDEMVYWIEGLFFWKKLEVVSIVLVSFGSNKKSDV